MKGMQVGVLYVTSHSLSIAIASEEPISQLDNATFLRLCKEGPLFEILSREYEDFSRFSRELSYYKVQTNTIFLDDCLPSIRWLIVNKKPCLEMTAAGTEGVVFSIRVKKE